MRSMRALRDTARADGAALDGAALDGASLGLAGSPAARRRPGLALRLLLFGMIALGSLRCAAPQTNPTPPDAATPHAVARPNVVIVLTDDQRWDTLGYMPSV